jgi:hypothetical protein
MNLLLLTQCSLINQQPAEISESTRYKKSTNLLACEEA